ncbi:MAG: hypothetical protein ACM3XM_16030 [Mycobacterium leprae]
MDQPVIRPGVLVQSLAGRDLGACYVVLRVLDGRRVAVADGRHRTVTQPKAKGRRHLSVLGWVDANLALRLERGDRVTDMEIMKALEALRYRILEEV